MKRALGVAAVLVCIAPAIASAQSYHRGYTRQDGTYVAPHWQSSPDRSYNNNWSVSPNTNPFTGQSGTRSPTWNDRTPSSNQNQFGNPGYASPYGSYGTRRP